jgi:hypothetical protein
MFLFLLACASNPAEAPTVAPAPAAPAAPAPATPAPAAPVNDKVNLGPAPDATAAIGIDEVIAHAADYEGKPVVVKAPVASVCQKKGCWHRLGTADPAVTVMCKDKEYEIFLPFDAAGKTAVVAGTFRTETVSVEDARHFAEDAGKDPATITGPVTEYSIELDGVAFLEG